MATPADSMEGDAVLQRAPVVTDNRSACHLAMHDRFVATVERLTGRRVAHFISSHHVGPDLELFVLADTASRDVRHHDAERPLARIVPGAGNAGRALERAVRHGGAGRPLPRMHGERGRQDVVAEFRNIDPDVCPPRSGLGRSKRTVEH